MVFYRTMIALSVFAVSGTAHAQEPERRERPASDEWSVSVGGGAIVSPKYLGDNAYDVSILPYIRVTKGDRFSVTVQDGARYAVVDTDGFQAGPLVQIDFGRDEDGSGPFRVSGDATTDLLGLGDIDTTVSFGGFASYEFGKLSLKAEAAQGINGHDGLTGSLGLSYGDRIIGYGPPLIYAIGPSLEFGDSDYVGAYFGVDTAQSAASGLPQYAADGGLVSYGVGGTAILPLTEHVSATIVANYKRLTGDTADAPLVTLRGSKDQVFAGAFLAYRFR